MRGEHKKLTKTQQSTNWYNWQKNHKSFLNFNLNDDNARIEYF